MFSPVDLNLEKTELDCLVVKRILACESRDSRESCLVSLSIGFGKLLGSKVGHTAQMFAVVLMRPCPNILPIFEKVNILIYVTIEDLTRYRTEIGQAVKGLLVTLNIRGSLADHKLSTAIRAGGILA